MGIITRILDAIFGNGRNVVKDTAEVFRENAEAGGVRAAAIQTAAIAQHGREFERNEKGLFDRFMDGVNRIPRPAMAIGALGLFISAMFNPVWFASRMQGLVLVPEPLWWLLGVVVSFYFGARHQAKGQEFQRSISETMARVPVVVENLAALEALGHEADKPEAPSDPMAPISPSFANGNPALAAWKAEQ